MPAGRARRRTPCEPGWGRLRHGGGDCGAGGGRGRSLPPGRSRAWQAAHTIRSFQTCGVPTSPMAPPHCEHISTIRPHHTTLAPCPPPYPSGDGGMQASRVQCAELLLRPDPSDFHRWQCSFSANARYNALVGPLAELADATDSKSVARKGMRVRVPRGPIGWGRVAVENRAFDDCLLLYEKHWPPFAK